MKTSKSTESTTRPEKGVVGVGDNNKAKRDGRKLDGSEIDSGKVDGGKIDDKIGKKSQKTSKSKNLFKSKKFSKSKKLSKFKKILRSEFLTPKAKLAFIKLRQVFVRAPILYHFDSKHHIWVETDVSGYAISEVLTQLTLDNSSQ